jgi:hypothetical protein
MLIIPRNLGFLGFWYALWGRPRSLVIGIWFTVFPLLIAIPMVFFVNTFIPKEPDHAKIRANGRSAQGHVLRIETVYNVTINEVHPRRVFFDYQDGDKFKTASMDTMSVDLVAGWHPGQPLEVKCLDGQATVPELQPVDFPFWLFALMPFIFATIGVPFLGYAVKGALDKRGLLMFGDFRKAKLLSLCPVQGIGTFSTSLLKTRFEANYVYKDDAGQEVYAKSLTTDLRLLNEKKAGDEIDILAALKRTPATQIVDAKLRELLATAS